jgi:hypothetical protein
MAHIEFDLASTAPPERVLAALTDFSERRPDLWPGLKREEFKAYEVGDTWAEVREGSGGMVWAHERYDWSKAGTVTWTVVDSGFSRTGDYVSVTATPSDDGGSLIHVVWDRRGKNLFGRFAVAMIVLLRGAPVKRSIVAGLKRIEAA